MANILGIIGIPRKGGNTEVLLEHILDGAKHEGAQVDTLFLADMNIKECIGCHACWRGKPCTRNDDMNDTFDVITSADGFVFGTPVYWYGPTAIIKAFLDRFVYFNSPDHRGMVKGKPVILAVPFEEDNPEMADLTVQLFKKSFGYLEMDLAGTIIAPGVTKVGEVRSKPAIMDEAFAAGQRIITGL